MHSDEMGNIIVNRNMDNEKLDELGSGTFSTKQNKPENLQR